MRCYVGNGYEYGEKRTDVIDGELLCMTTKATEAMECLNMVMSRKWNTAESAYLYVN